MSSLAGTYSITVDQGATFSETLVWRTKRSRTPIDLTGYTARMKVKGRNTGSPLLLTLTTENGGILLGGAEGTVVLAISATDTAAIIGGIHSYDLELIDSESRVTRLLKGSFVVRPEVTD